MKTSHIIGITLLFILLVFVLAAATNFDHQTVSAQNLSVASLPLQNLTPTPIAGDHSEVGSTDGIVIMGVVLVIVVTVPLLFRRKRKNNK